MTYDTETKTINNEVSLISDICGLSGNCLRTLKKKLNNVAEKYSKG